MDGFDICRFLKQQDATKNIPVIMISASAYIKEKVEEAGADDYIEKPFRAKTLIEMMEKYLAVPE
jgi:CheY-like chemotaxis protein